MFDLRLQVVIYPEKEWSDWESKPQQHGLLFCGLNTYRLQRCAFVDNPLHESPRTLTKTLTQNSSIDSHLFRWVKCQECHPLSKTMDQTQDLSRQDAIGVLCSVALDASFSCNSTQTILGRRHFGIRCKPANLSSNTSILGLIDSFLLYL